MGEIPKGAPQGEAVGPYLARTSLGARLLHLRKQIVASGEPLLSWEALDRELADRRGGATRQD